MLKKVLAHRKSGQMYQHLADILYPLINFPIKNWFAEVQANPDFKLTITQKLLAALHEFVGTPQKSAGLAGGGSAAAAGRGRKRRREAVACEDEAYRTVAPLRAVLAAPVADPGVAAPTISPK
jgi:hypothetical protein